LLVLKIAEGAQQQKKRIVMPLQADGAQQQICDGSVRMVMLSTSKDRWFFFNGQVAELPVR